MWYVRAKVLTVIIVDPYACMHMCKHHECDAHTHTHAHTHARTHAHTHTHTELLHDTLGCTRCMVECTPINVM